MQANAAHVLDVISDVEDGYQDNRADPGNWTGGAVGKGRLLGTNHGITPRTLAAARNVSVETLTVNDMRSLGLREAQEILTKQYLAKVAFDDLPGGLDLALADCAVNSGPAQAASLLQGVLGVEVDGIIGLHTVAAIATSGAVDLIHAYSQARMSFLRRLPSWETFGRGWASRVARVESEAVSMATGKDHVMPDLAPGAGAKAPPAQPPSGWAALIAAILSIFRKGPAHG